jgi:hypothetical protein
MIRNIIILGSRISGGGLHRHELLGVDRSLETRHGHNALILNRRAIRIIGIGHAISGFHHLTVVFGLVNNLLVCVFVG